MRSTDYASAEELKALGREPREALIPGFPGYLVDELGRVWSCRGMWYNPGGTRNWRPHSISLSGRYYVASLYTDDGKVHVVQVRKLVALAFLGPKPPGWKLISKDRDTTNHRLGNLEYRAKQPLPPHFRPGQRKKVTDAQVIAMRRRAHAGEGPADLMGEFGLTYSAVRGILTCKFWPHVDAGVPTWTPDRVKRAPRSPLTPEQWTDIETQLRHGRSLWSVWNEKYSDLCGYTTAYVFASRMFGSLRAPKLDAAELKRRRAARRRAWKQRKRREKQEARDGKPLDARTECDGPVVGPAG